MAEKVHRPGGDNQGMCGVQTAGDADHDLVDPEAFRRWTRPWTWMLYAS